MVELVDTRDLKSLGHNGCAGSSPARATTCYLFNGKREQRKLLSFCFLRVKSFHLFLMVSI